MTTKQGKGRPKGQTDGRALVLAALVQFKAENDGLSPTVLDLCGMTGLAESSIKYHLLKLQNAGQIIRVRQGYKIPGARWLPPADEQPAPDQDAELSLRRDNLAEPPDQDTPPERPKMAIVPFSDMGDVESVRRERDHYKRASEMHLVEADTARAQLAKVEGQLQAARLENKQLKAELTERDREIAQLRAELANRGAGRLVPVRFVPAPAPLGMTG